MFINKGDRVVNQWKDNLQRYDYVNNFTAWKNFTQSLTTKINSSAVQVGLYKSNSYL